MRRPSTAKIEQVCWLLCCALSVINIATIYLFGFGRLANVLVVMTFILTLPLMVIALRRSARGDL